VKKLIQPGNHFAIQFLYTAAMERKAAADVPAFRSITTAYNKTS